MGDGICLENSRGFVAPWEFDSPSFRLSGKIAQLVVALL